MCAGGISVDVIVATSTLVTIRGTVIENIVVSGYTIVYTNTDNTDCFTSSATISVTDTSLLSYDIQNLEEYTEYDFNTRRWNH